MKNQNLKTQLHDNAIAIISLIVAIVALVLNTWRLEQTERNRNARQAGFEILKNLGELQAVINTNIYEPEGSKTPPLRGWSYITMMSDMAVLMPPSIQDELNELIKVWGNNWKNIPTDENSADQITHQIDLTREGVMQALNQLH